MEMTQKEKEQIFEITKDNRFVVKVPYIRVYIPSDFFEHGIAEIVGSDVNTFGIFKFDVYGLDSKKFDESNPFVNPTRMFFEMPMVVKMCPSSITQERNSDKELITVFEFVQGDAFLSSLDFIQTWKNISKLLDLLLKGFLPKEIDYDKVIPFLNECQKLNKANYAVADTIEEIMVAELYRDPNNLSRAFRFAIRDDPNIKMNQAVTAKMEALGRMYNTFAAISSGDPKQGITMSIIRERYGEPQKESSIELALRDV